MAEPTCNDGYDPSYLRILGRLSAQEFLIECTYALAFVQLPVENADSIAAELVRLARMNDPGERDPAKIMASFAVNATCAATVERVMDRARQRSREIREAMARRNADGRSQ